MDWTKLLKVADVLVDVGQKVAQVVRRRRQPPAAMARPHEAEDVVEAGRREHERVRGR